MATNWQIGDKIENRWEIYKILKGGMGIVYVVYDHEFRETFAAKTFQDEVLAKNPQTADLFTREALAWVNLDVHQNVTRARFVETIEGKPVSRYQNLDQALRLRDPGDRVRLKIFRHGKHREIPVVLVPKPINN